MIDSEAGKVTINPHDMLYITENEDPLELIIKSDGTYTNSENKYITAETVYEKSIMPLQKLAESHGVGFMVNEFGIFGCGIDWNINIIAAHAKDMVAMFEAHDIPWSYCELYNPVPKHIINIYKNEFQWKGSISKEWTYTYKDGSSDIFWVNTQLLDAFTKYTLAH